VWVFQSSCVLINLRYYYTVLTSVLQAKIFVAFTAEI